MNNLLKIISKNGLKQKQKPTKIVLIDDKLYIDDKLMGKLSNLTISEDVDTYEMYGIQMINYPKVTITSLIFQGFNI